MNEIDKKSAELLVKNGVKYVAEGANMPSTLGAIDVFQSGGVVFLPAKAANAGGGATSALEMAHIDKQHARQTYPENKLVADFYKIVV